MSAFTGRTWKAPEPPPKKAHGIEGDAAYIVELWLSGDRDKAKARWKQSRDKLIKAARGGMPRPGSRGGSANWGVAADVAWCVMEPGDPEPWQLLEQYAEWVVTVALWSIETTSSTYGWILHLLCVAWALADTLAKDMPAAKKAAVAVGIALAAHRWLLEKMLVRGAGRGKGRIKTHPKLVVKYDPLFHGPGERSPPSRHTGTLLTSWIRGCTLDSMTDPEVTRKSEDQPHGWASWPYRLLRGVDLRKIVPRGIFPDGGIRLRKTLTIGRDGDDFVAFTDLHNPNTSGTAATSYINGDLYVLDLGQKDRRVKRVETRWEGQRITARSSDGLTGSIPAPAREDCTVLVIPEVNPKEFRDPAERKPGKPRKPRKKRST